MTIHIVALEPIDNRYTADWLIDMPSLFKEHGFYDIEVIMGDTQTKDTIDKRLFLDIFDTQKWKSSQVIKIAELLQEGKIKTNDTLFFMDFWFPIEQIRYMIDLAEIDVKLIGIAHAGHYDRWDFLGQNERFHKWAEEYENCFYYCYDKILFASDSHRKMFVDSFGYYEEEWDEDKEDFVSVENSKLVLIPDLFYWLTERAIQRRIDSGEVKRLAWEEREDIIVMPIRNAPEKQPHLVELLELEKRFPNYSFVIPMEQNLNKVEYFNLLGRSKGILTFALQETFGIGPIEAWFLGCKPILPDRLSYVEMIPEQYRYKRNSDVLNHVSALSLTATPPVYAPLNRNTTRIDDLLEVIFFDY